jgi:hypothetical protein
VTVLSTQRDTVEVYLCDGYGFEGDCVSSIVNTKECYDVSSDWDNRISSFAPPQGAFCTIFSYVNFPVNTERPIT